MTIRIHLACTQKRQRRIVYLIMTWEQDESRQHQICHFLCANHVVTETFTYVYMLSKSFNCTSNIKDVLVIVCSQGECSFYHMNM